MMSPEPESRTGVYSHISDVPTHLRLSTIKTSHDRDPIQHYMDDQGLSAYKTEMHLERFAERVGDHYAYAEPDDVIDFFTNSGVSTYKLITRGNYYSDIYRFMSWLVSHRDFPHVYNSAILAAIENDDVRKVWNERTDYDAKYERPDNK